MLLVTTALIVAAYQRVLSRAVGTPGHQPLGDRLERPSVATLGDGAAGDLHRQGRRCAQSLSPGALGRQGITGALADGRTMYPPEVGLRAEDSILEQLASQARETLAQLKTDGVVGDDVELQVVTGNGWDEALDDADWQDGDLLAIGTSPVGGIVRVFLGSRGSKILRHSPVPVLVLPG